MRGRQNNQAFQWTDEATGAKRPLSLADMLVAAAAVAVKQCSAGALNLTITLGRPEATVADDHPLPSPQGVIDDKHNSIFQTMVSQGFRVERRTGTWDSGELGQRMDARGLGNLWHKQQPCSAWVLMRRRGACCGVPCWGLMHSSL